MDIKYATISECGKRSNNEDSFKVIDSPERSSWVGIVCDGLGGHPMGEVASASVVESIAKYCTEHPGEHVIDTINEACKFASHNLDAKGDQFNHVEMGTTLVMAWIESSRRKTK